MHAPVPFFSSIGKLQSPRPLRSLFRSVRLRRLTPSIPLELLQEFRAEIELRELWIEIHEGAGATERSARLELECVVLRAHVKMANDLFLSRKLARNGTPA